MASALSVRWVGCSATFAAFSQIFLDEKKKLENETIVFFYLIRMN